MSYVSHILYASGFHLTENRAWLCFNRLQSLREKTQRRERRDSTSDDDEDEEDSEDEELEAYENDAPFPMVRAAVLDGRKDKWKDEATNEPRNKRRIYQ